MNILQHKKALAIADQLVTSGGNFLTGILVARWIGLEDFGIFSIWWMLILFGLSISQAVITKPLLSLLPKKDTTEQSQYISSLFYVQLFIIFALVLLILVGYSFSSFFNINIPIGTTSYLVLALLFFQLLHDYFRKIGFALAKMTGPLLLDTVLFSIQICGLCLVFSYGTLDVKRVIFMLLIGSIIACTVAIFWAIHNGISFQFSIKNISKTLKEHYNFSKWLLGTSLLQWLSGNYFIIVGATLLGPVAVGAIRIIQQIMGLCHIIFLALENVVPVEAAQHFLKEGIPSLFHFLQKTLLQLIFPVLLALFMLVIGIDLIIDFIYGEEYLAYSYLINGFSVLYFFVFISLFARIALRTMENTKPIFVAYSFSTIFSLLAAKPMLLYWGIDGLVLGLVLTQVSSLFIYALYLRRSIVKSYYTA